MIRIRLFIIITILAGSLSGFAQQEIQITHFMFNQFSFNPAFAGMRDAICFNILGRQQWVGFTDGEDKVNPQTNLFTIDAPIDRINSGLGLTLLTDKLGFEENMQVRLNYSYKFNLGLGKMAVGLSLGMLNKTIDFSKFKPLDPNDPLLVAQGKESDMMIDYSIGVYYNVPNLYYVGVSSSQLSESDFKAALSDVPYSLRRHYYLVGGYFYELPNPAWAINPNILLKSDFGSTQVDVNVLGIYNNKYWGGISYRAYDALAIMLGAFPFNSGGLENLRAGYAYDITTSKLGRGGRSSGSHELFLNYCFKIVIVKPKSSYSNIRYLPSL